MSRAIARAPVEVLDELDEDDAGDADEEEGAEEDEEEATLAKPRVVQAVPYQPVRSAVRDELGRQVAQGAIRAGAAVLPGLALVGVAGVVGWRLWTGVTDWWDAWQAKRKGDPSIQVKVMPAGDRRTWTQEERRVVDVGLAGDAPPAPAPAKPPVNLGRMEFLLAREAYTASKKPRGRRRAG